MSTFPMFLLTILLLLISFFFQRRHHARAPGSLEEASQTRPKRYVVLRIREISKEKLLEDLIQDLTEITAADPILSDVVTTIDRVSLVHTRGLWACATASFHSELSDTELVERFSRATATTCFKYQYDCTFYGITPIYEDKASQIDILAVPGLASHAIGSWKAAGGSDIWLRDYLPYDIPGLRILLYGYETNLLKSKSRKSIEDMGKMLLESVNAFRAEHHARRPIIVIGHSLGGLLVKEALLHANKSRRYDLANTCAGLLLFGVPNHGLRNEQLLSLVKGQPNEPLVRDLVVDQDTEASAFLKRISSQFAESAKGRYHIISFYELKLSSIIKKHPDGRLTKSGNRALLVTYKSATSTGITAAADEDNVALDADHSGLVKFSSRSCESYLIVKERLRRLVAGISTMKGKPGELEPQAMRAWRNMNSPPYSSFRSSARLNKAAPGTLQWILKAPTSETSDCLHLQPQDFQTWRDSDSSQCLLLTGPPGQGKSVLSNFIISSLQNCALPSSKIIYHFCTIRDSDIDDRNAGSVLRSLLVQLCEDQQQLFDLIPTDITKQSRLFREAPVDTLLDIFKKMLRSNIYETVYCIIDGLDVYRDGMSHLVHELSRLFDASSEDGRSTIKLLCTSRPRMSIALAWGRSPRKALCCKPDDLQRFIRSRIVSLEPHFTDDMRRNIETQLTHNVGTTFLWIDVVFRRLRNMSLPTSASIDKEITDSSLELYELYNNLLQGLLQLDKQYVIILAWVFQAQRPLKCGELAEAISVDIQDEKPSYQKCSRNKPCITPDQLLRNLGTLVDVLDDTVYLMHQSVKDFLDEGDPLKKFFGHIRTALIPAYVTVTYLQLEDIPPSVLQEQHSFFQYCVQHWYDHIASTSDIHEEDRLRRLIARTIDPNVRQARDWLQYALNYAPASIEYPSDVALEFDIGWLAEALLDLKFEDIECQFGEDCLSKAASKGGAVLEVLLQHKASQDFILTQHAAATIMEKFGIEVIETLLQKRGEDLFMTNGLVRGAAANWISGGDIMRSLFKKWGRNVHVTTDVLLAAATNAFEGFEIMSLLLETCGNDIEVTPRVLTAAAGNWRAGEEMLRLLLNKKKNQLQITGSVLQAAARNAFEGSRIMRLLLGEYRERMPITADVMTAAAGNWRCGDDLVKLLLLQCNQGELLCTEDVLAAAARNGAIKVEMLNTLIPQTKTVNGKGKDGWTPLSAAASVGRLDVVKLLVAQKAETTLANKDGRTPAHMAAGFGHFNVIDFLFNHKAVMTMADKAGKGPIHDAALNGHLQVVKFLIDQGANINVASKDGRLPIHGAAENGHLEVVKTLFHHQEDIAMADKASRRPIHDAALNGHLQVVKFLIDQGANINVASKDGRLPIHGAAENGHLEVVKTLIHHQADTTTADKAGVTPLSAAARNGHFDVIRFLVDHKAHIITPDKYGTTPLHLAALGGHIGIAKFMFSKAICTALVNKGGWNLVHAAVSRGNPEISRLICATWAEQQVVNIRGQKLPDKMDNDEPDVVRMLFDSGTDAGGLKKNEWNIRVRQNRYGYHDIKCLSAQKNLSYESFSNNESAIVPGQKSLELARYFLQGETKPSRRNRKESDPQDKKHYFSTLGMLKAALSHNDNIARMKENSSNTSGWMESDVCFYLTKFLVLEGEDVNITSKSGATAIHLASQTVLLTQPRIIHHL